MAYQRDRTKHVSSLVYTNNDDGVWLECNNNGKDGVWLGCEWRTNLGLWPTVERAAEAWQGHLKEVASGEGREA